jgi:hypothetical protein
MTDDGRIDRNREDAETHVQELDADEDALLNDRETEQTAIDADDDVGPAM